MAEGLKKQIIIVSDQFSVVVKGLEKKVIDAGYFVNTVEDDADIIKNYLEVAALFILYLPQDITDQIKIRHLMQYSGIIRESGTNMLLIGEGKTYDEVMDIVPSLKKYRWLNRPVNIETFADIVEKEATKKPDSGIKNILIVDDDPSYAKMVREWLKPYYKVNIVTVGMQAISYLFKNKVDLILLDYEMPVVDGPQVFQMLKQDPETENIPVLFLTGVGSKEGVQRVMELKPDGYILKSTPREELMRSVEGVLQKYDKK